MSQTATKLSAMGVVTFEEWSDSGRFPRGSVVHIRQFCLLMYTFRWKWPSYVNKIFHDYLLPASMWARLPVAKSLSCWQVRRQQILHMAIFVLIAMQNISQNFIHHICRSVLWSVNLQCAARLHTTTRLLLHCCGHFFIWHRINSFPPSTRHVRTFLFEFRNHFFKESRKSPDQRLFSYHWVFRMICRVTGTSSLIL